MKATEELVHTHDVVRKVLEIFTPGNLNKLRDEMERRKTEIREVFKT